MADRWIEAANYNFHFVDTVRPYGVFKQKKW